MRYLTVSEVIELYRQVMEASGGTVGILSIESLESAVANRVQLLVETNFTQQLLKKLLHLAFHWL